MSERLRTVNYRYLAPLLAVLAIAGCGGDDKEQPNPDKNVVTFADCPQGYTKNNSSVSDPSRMLRKLPEDVSEYLPEQIETVDSPEEILCDGGNGKLYFTPRADVIIGQIIDARRESNKENSGMLS